MTKIDDFLKTVHITVHGGMDYKEETAEAFNFRGRGHGHPILSIEMGKTVRHFKCTSVNPLGTRSNPSWTHKGVHTRDKFYTLKDPAVCDLDKTYKALRQPNMQPVVDFNHSVHIVNDETPPLPLYPNGLNGGTGDQTSFEVSDDDKKGILMHLITQVDTYGKVRQPSVSKTECVEADRDWLNRHPNRQPHPVQVVNTPSVTLSLEDLDLAELSANKLFH